MSKLFGNNPRSRVQKIMSCEVTAMVVEGPLDRGGARLLGPDMQEAFAHNLTREVNFRKGTNDPFSRFGFDQLRVDNMIARIPGNFQSDVFK